MSEFESESIRAMSEAKIIASQTSKTKHVNIYQIE